MFSRNGMISEKQMRRILVLSVYASLIFVLPYLSAWLFGESIVPGLAVFFALACIYIACIYALSLWLRKTVTGCGEGEKSIAGWVLVLMQVLRLIIRLAFYICLTIEVLSEGQVPFMPENAGGNGGRLLVAVPLLLVALYAANIGGGENGVERQGRIYELIFWMLFIPLVLVLLFGIPEVDFSIFVPQTGANAGVLLFRAYLLLPFLLPVENYLLLRPFLQEETGDGKKDKHIGVTILPAVLGTVLLVCILTLFMLGIYGVQGAGSEEMLTVSIMRYVRLPLGFIERVDVLLVWFFMIGCFVLIGQTLYFMGMLLSHISDRSAKIWLQAVLLAAAVALAVFLPNYGDALWVYRIYGAVADIPFSIVLPVLGVLTVQLCNIENQERKED